MDALVLIGELGFIALLFLILAMILAYAKWHFTRIEKGNTVFISKGDDIKAIWPNVGGYRMSDEEDLDGRHWLIKTEFERETAEREIWKAFSRDMAQGTKWLQKLLWNWFGIRFVSWFWPQVKVHEFAISRKRLKEGADVETGKPLKSRIVASPLPPEVRSLLFLVPRPVYLEGVELAGDNSKVNLLLLTVFQQVIPALPVYYLKGDFFPLLDAAIEAALVDLFATHLVAVNKDGEFLKDTYVPGKHKPSFLTYSHWLRLKKGAGSPIESHLRKLNASYEYYEELEKKGKVELLRQLERLTGGKPEPIKGAATSKQIPHGIIARFGFALVSIRLVDWEPHESTKPLAEALLAEQIKMHLAKGVRQEAAGERDAFHSRGEGEARRYTSLLESLIKQGVDPNAAAEVLRTQLEMEQLHGAGVSTYVRGQAAGVLVPAQASVSPPPSA